jgi:hypothetical protein
MAHKGEITNACSIPLGKFEGEKQNERNGYRWEGSVKINL